MSGLEILGLAASVIQIAELGGKLSVQLFTFTRKVKNANKSIDALSQELASTGAVLKQLGDTLTKDKHVQVCSQEAIATARGLVDDTNRVFTNLQKVIVGDEKSNDNFLKGIGFKQRLKFPFLENQIEQVQANLERLKSSLLVILNVLIFAEQLRNQEALPILKDQRELIKVLASEKDENEKRYKQILAAIADKPQDNGTKRSIDPSTSPDGSIKTTFTTLSTASTIVSPEPMSPTPEPSTKPPAQVIMVPKIVLPTGLQRHHERIHHHSYLVQNLLSEIASLQYNLDLSTRDRMQNGILNMHWDEWSMYRLRHGHEHFEKMLNTHPDVASYWTDRLQDHYSRQLEAADAVRRRQSPVSSMSSEKTGTESQTPTTTMETPVLRGSSPDNKDQSRFASVIDADGDDFDSEAAFGLAAMAVLDKQQSALEKSVTSNKHNEAGSPHHTPAHESEVMSPRAKQDVPSSQHSTGTGLGISAADKLHLLAQSNQPLSLKPIPSHNEIDQPLSVAPLQSSSTTVPPLSQVQTPTRKSASTSSSPPALQSERTPLTVPSYFTKARIRYISPEVLEWEKMPWLYDPIDKDYLVIKQFLRKPELDQLSQQTQVLQNTRGDRLAGTDASSEDVLGSPRLKNSFVVVPAPLYARFSGKIEYDTSVTKNGDEKNPLFVKFELEPRKGPLVKAKKKSVFYKLTNVEAPGQRSPGQQQSPVQPGSLPQSAAMSVFEELESPGPRSSKRKGLLSWKGSKSADGKTGSVVSSQAEGNIPGSAAYSHKTPAQLTQERQRMQQYGSNFTQGQSSSPIDPYLYRPSIYGQQNPNQSIAYDAMRYNSYSMSEAPANSVPHSTELVASSSISPQSKRTWSSASPQTTASEENTSAPSSSIHTEQSASHLTDSVSAKASSQGTYEGHEKYNMQKNSTENRSYGAYGYGQPTTEDGDEEEDIADMKDQIRIMKPQDVLSNRNALRTATVTQETGPDTLARLSAQGERIHNTNRNPNIDHNATNAMEDKPEEPKTLNKAMFATHVNNPSLAPRRAPSSSQSQHDNKSVPPSKASTSKPSTQAQQKTSIAERAKYRFDADSDDDRMEDEIDYNLGDLGGAAKRLNVLGRAMGKEVDAQSRTLQTITDISGVLAVQDLDETDKLILQFSSLDEGEYFRGYKNKERNFGRLKRIQ